MGQEAEDGAASGERQGDDVQDERVGEVFGDGFRDLELGDVEDGVGVWWLVMMSRPDLTQLSFEVTAPMASVAHNRWMSEDVLKLYPTVGPTHVSVP